jgi:hypothetical protein
MSSIQEKLYLALNKATGSDGSFDSTFKDIIASSPASDILNGLSPRTKISCLSNTLQHLSDNHQDESVARQLWNPVIAAYASILDEIARDHPEIFSVCQSTAVPVKASKKEAGIKPAVPSGIIKTTKPSTNVKTIAPTYASAAQKEPTVTSSSTQAKASPKPAGSGSTPVSAKVDTKQVHCMLTDLRLRPGQSYYPGFCASASCKFCRDMFAAIELTACRKDCDHPGKHIAWYPHVGKSLRKILGKAHREQRPFVNNKDVLSEGALPPLCKPLGASTSAAPASPSAVNKRKSSIEIASVVAQEVKNMRLDAFVPADLEATPESAGNWNEIMTDPDQSANY